MGRMQAEGYAEALAADPTILESVVNAHLTSNWFPAMPPCWTAPAVDAIIAVAEDLPEEKIDITFACELTKSQPRGAVEDGERVVVDAGILVQVFKLEPFVKAVSER